MSDFKKLLEEDIDAVFLDDDIFAEEHNIDGKPMRAVICNDTLKEAGGHWEGGIRQSYGTAIYSTSKKLYVKKQDYGRMPKIGNPIRVDEMTLYIQDFDEQQGMYVMTIERKRQ